MRGLVRTLAVSPQFSWRQRAVYAQATIAGVVKDASGAVLPGVSVEAASPALTEKVRSVVTDGTGQYRIVALPPGAYTVTFTLQGSTPSSVKASAADRHPHRDDRHRPPRRARSKRPSRSPANRPSSTSRALGASRSSTATSSSPFRPRGSYNNVLQLVPGVVAGDGQVQLRPTMLLFTAHGGNAEDGRLTLDGINTGASRGGAGVSGYIPDMQNTAEVTFTISGNLGEAETGGPQMTVVPKSGGNTLSGSFFISGLNDSMQGNNFDDDAAERAGGARRSRCCCATTRCRSAGRSRDRDVVLLQPPPRRRRRRPAGHLRQQERRRSHEMDLRAGLHAAGPHRPERAASTRCV